MTFPVQILHRGIVGVFVRNEVCAANLATVWIATGAVEDFLVQVDVVDVDGTVEGEGDHLGHVGRLEVAGNSGTIGRAEAIGEDTLGWVAVGGSVGISFHSCEQEKKGVTRDSGFAKRIKERVME